MLPDDQLTCPILGCRVATNINGGPSTIHAPMPSGIADASLSTRENGIFTRTSNSNATLHDEAALPAVNPSAAAEIMTDARNVCSKLMGITKHAGLRSRRLQKRSSLCYIPFFFPQRRNVARRRYLTAGHLQRLWSNKQGIQELISNRRII